MKGTAAILRSHIGVGSLRILVPVLLVMAAAGAFLLVTSPAAAGPPIDDLNLPVEVEETRDVPKRVQRQVQGQGVSITQQATPTPGKLVGNTGQTSTVLGFTVTSDHSQAFTTGSNRAAYKLTHIAILLAHLGGGQQAAYSVYIAEDSGGRPGTSLGTLSGSPTLTNNPTAYAFTATGDGIDLEPDTTYWVVVDADLGGATNTGTRVAAIDADGEDSDGADGWSLADNLFYRPQSQTSASAWQAHASSSLALRVNGYVKPPPALVSAEVNETSLVLTFDKDLDTTSRPAARQFGIKFGGGGKLQRATRISISGRQVTLTVPEVRVGQLVTVSYTVPTSNRLKGSDGPEVDAIVNYTVKVNTGPAYGRLPEGSEKVRDAVYVTYNNANGEEETVENRAASADCETLYDY
ncbi:MAG: SwmB domain-containing protein, partial [Chloroflexi bacterium]|nr:SwmB domain-containing protein [Chloroflexota bacterium]